MTIFKEFKIIEWHITDIYCYYDNYKTLLEKMKSNGYICLKMKYITDQVVQVILWQDYNVLMQFTQYINHALTKDFPIPKHMTKVNFNIK